MQTIEIKAAKRENLGKAATRELRKSGKVPSVLYGGKENIHFSAEDNEYRKLLYTPNVYIVNLNIDGTNYSAIIKDKQFHPVSGDLIHIDFLQVFEDKPVVIELPVKLVGLAEGVKAGGKLSLEQRKLKVKGLSKNLPDVLEVDITNLGLGKGIQVGELNYEGLELLNAKNSVVAAVKLTRAARAAQQKD